MDAAKWLVFLACLCCKGASPWTVEVPSSVKGLLGSCVVIPCTFGYPDPGRSVTSFTGIWLDSTSHPIYHPVESKTQQQYRGRTTLVGDIRHKDCSLMIDPLKQNDGGPFHFRIEIADFDSFSFKTKQVSLVLNNVPNPTNLSVDDEVVQGQAVSASCSVSHSCPSSPPVFNWSRSGVTSVRSRRLEDGQWEATSTLTFYPTRFDHARPLQCVVRFKGGQHQQAFKNLSVKYSPVKVSVEYKAEVKEGEAVHLSCTAESRPPVSSYEWHNGTGALLHKGKVFTLPNVSRHTAGPLYCLAINPIGRAKSSPVQLSVLYAPLIRSGSSCSLEGNVVKCVCIVESRPPSTVHFVVADKVLQSTKVERHGSLTLWTLQTELGSSEPVHCLANNTQGHAALQLTLPANSNWQNILIGSGSAVVILVILVTVTVGAFAFRKRRKTPTVTSALNVLADKAVVTPEYSTTKRNEAYKSAGSFGVNANDPIYGNLDNDGDDAIYANV